MASPAAQVTGAAVSLFAIDLGAARAAWKKDGPRTLAALHPGGRLATALDAGEPAAALFDAFVEDRAAAHVFDAPFAALAGALDSINRAAGLRSLDIGGLEEAPSAYPQDVPPKGGARLVAWLEAVPPEAAVAAHGELGAVPRGVDPELWRDLVALLATLLDAAARPGMAVVGHMG